MNKETTLILRMKKNDLFFGEVKGYDIENYFNYICNIKIVNKIIRKLNLLDCTVCYGSWKYKINQYNTIIVFDTMYYTGISKYIKKKKQNVIIKLFFWNSINENNNFILSDKNVDDIYSFDTRDAENYNLNFNPTFFTRNIVDKKLNIKREVLFLGRAKQRKELVLEIEHYLNQMDISNTIRVVEKESEMIPYEIYLAMCMESNCLLDIVGPEQSGLTLRCVEALFLNKKLITNNIYIKQYDFYNENNILVLTEDFKKGTIISFLKNNYEDIPDSIKLRYNFEAWFNRFFE